MNHKSFFLLFIILGYGDRAGFWRTLLSRNARNARARCRRAADRSGPIRLFYYFPVPVRCADAETFRQRRVLLAHLLPLRVMAFAGRGGTVRRAGRRRSSNALPALPGRRKRRDKPPGQFRGRKLLPR